MNDFPKCVVADLTEDQFFFLIGTKQSPDGVPDIEVRLYGRSRENDMRLMVPVTEWRWIDPAVFELRLPAARHVSAYYRLRGGIYREFPGLPYCLVADSATLYRPGSGRVSPRRIYSPAGANQRPPFEIPEG